MLVVDLDGTLIKTDLLLETVLTLLKRKPLFLFVIPFWVFKGPLYFKKKVASYVEPHVKNLPIRENILKLVIESKNQKIPVVLASASPHSWIQEIHKEFSFFDDAWGTVDHNLKGEAKLSFLKEKYQDRPFTYVGDASVDLPLWTAAEKVVAINPNPRLEKAILKLQKPTEIIHEKKNTPRLIVKQLRPHQWVKNLLLFVPPLAAHKISDVSQLQTLAIAFLSFSFAASAVYIFNDLLDLESDRQHHSKRRRPFASGDLSLMWGALLLPSLVLGAVALSFGVSTSFTAWILIYWGMNVLYTYRLKKVLVLDIVVLSLMYSIRIFAGGAATQLPVSDWLLSFSTLFFFSLASVKRYTEIIRSKVKLTIEGRGYRQVDDTAILVLGAGTGLMSIVVFLLYLQSEMARKLYPSPQYLWFITPLLLYWMTRLWVLTNRNEIHDDPVVFAAKDKVSWLCFAVMIGIMGIAAL